MAAAQVCLCGPGSLASHRMRGASPCFPVPSFWALSRGLQTLSKEEQEEEGQAGVGGSSKKPGGWAQKGLAQWQELGNYWSQGGRPSHRATVFWKRTP